ncbi:piggyBac transposable element-derived protein 4-like [Diaphorina citri]|uniref:PiggyBac transposable element-derived protein 4-like n=1 Tax=Diaphorina citri TaxID=121845 RepID=A0A1S3DGC1_DIACI|nr:piggyBac transposable element-derived protein 4-like [Diaphorina citri]
MEIDDNEHLVSDDASVGNEGEEDIEETSGDDDLDDDAPLNFFVARDGKTKWYPTRPTTKKDKVQMSHYPGVQNIAKDAFSPLDCWKLFFDNAFLEEIVRCTNKFILVNRDEKKKDLNEKYTDLAELRALCGLLYMCSMYGNNFLSPADLWRTDGTGIEIFSLTMSYTRFQFLSRSLNFDDIKTRPTRKEQDKLAQVRTMTEMFLQNCQKVFSVSDLVSIKEKYEPFQGKCSFKQYLPNSTKKYGVKFYTALDAIMFYTFNFEIDVPNQVEGEHKVDNSPESVVLRLCTPVLHEGRTVICDHPYATPLLAKKLLSKQTYLVGRWDRHEQAIPKHFASAKQWGSRKRIQVGYTEDVTLVATLKKKSCLVTASTRPDENPDELNTLVSTVHDMVDRVTDSHDSITVNTPGTRWPMLVFYFLLNTAATNALIISRCNGNDVTSRRDFIRDLSMSLCHDHLVARLLCESVPITMKARIAKITKSQIPTVALECPPTSRHRCQECPSKKNRKTTNICKHCRKFLCIELYLPLVKINLHKVT